MSPTFVNTNFHRVYVVDPDDSDHPEPQRINPGAEVDATGRYADALAETAGVLVKDSDEHKALVEEREISDLASERPGPAAFPATDEASGGVEGSPDDFEKMKVPQLAKLAKAADVEVEGTGKKGRKTKKDYIKALNSVAAGGAVTTDDVPSGE